jgi:hypothetical protein
MKGIEPLGGALCLAGPRAVHLGPFRVRRAAGLRHIGVGRDLTRLELFTLLCHLYPSLP